jgi:hypothetical protein
MWLLKLAHLIKGVIWEVTDLSYNEERDCGGLESSMSESGFLQLVTIDQEDNQWEVKVLVGKQRLEEVLNPKSNRWDFQRVRIPGDQRRTSIRPQCCRI